MPDLIAQGSERRFRWRRPLPPSGQSVWLGREPGTWAVPWDPCVSRRHAELSWHNGGLEVRVDSGATNPVFFDGQPQDDFRLSLGQHFVIGATRFLLAKHQALASLDIPAPDQQRTYSVAALRGASFRHAQQQIHALSRIPELVAGATTNQELLVRLVNLLLTGVAQATVAAVVREGAESNATSPKIELLHWDRVDDPGRNFQPSARLIHAALASGQSVVHCWQRAADVTAATHTDDFAWAFCTPIAGVACRGWAMYVAGVSGEFADPSAESLQDALKFSEVIGTTVGSVCDVRQLQRQATSLAHFFSPAVRDAVAISDADVALAPRQTQVSVLFCDLRGFSRHSEQSADDLFGLLRRVSEALGMVTHQILEHGGVIGDFHGDAAMGFWGWPLEQADLVERACRAALDTYAGFRNASDDQLQPDLAGFRVGLGLATGQAVAGRIGTIDQVKVTVFGPVVNVASRLEGLTRAFGAPILIDEVTARALDSVLPSLQAGMRPIATVRPQGMDRSMRIYELVPAPEARRLTTGRHREAYAQALEAFERGDWISAREGFSTLADEDYAADFLLRYMERCRFQPPPNWDGILNYVPGK